MPDPVTTLAALTSALGLAKTASDTTKTGLDIISKAKETLKKDDVSTELLRLALIEVDHNLSLIATLQLDKLDDSQREGLLTAATHLKYQALTALLLQWPQPQEIEQPTSYSGASIEKWHQQQDQADKAEQILANARFIASRSSALASAAQLPPVALKRLRLGQRYRNLKRANLKLLRLLRKKSAIAHLLQRRETEAPPA